MFRMKKNGNKYMLNYACNKCKNYTTILNHIKQKNHVMQKKIDIGKCNHCDKQVTKDNFYLFDFDHLRDKVKTVSQLIGKSTIKKIDEEIAKCQLLCCKCHKLKTAEQLNYRYEFPNNTIPT